MEVPDHYNCKELLVEAIDKINKHLKEINAPYTLSDDHETFETNYNLYIAKKKSGKPKDDYPGK